jgi:putative Ca2+/H+ antiporter (TMEM165/GDT1 family)
MDWRVFLTTFAALFIAELGDKTQLAVITMTGKHQKPLPIFLGATLALACVTLLGVLGGQAVYRLLPAEMLRRLSAGLFIVLGLLMWFEIL